MGLNLHSVVRGAIQAVSPDTSVNWIKSTGYTTAVGRSTPQYAAVVVVPANIQPPSGRDLRQIEFLNIQGTTRVAYLYSNPQGIVRVDAKGGDLIQFPEFNSARDYIVDSNGQPVTDSNGNPIWSVAPGNTWLITGVSETWDVTGGGWSKVFITLQLNKYMDYIIDSNGNFVVDSSGNYITGSSAY